MKFSPPIDLTPRITHFCVEIGQLAGTLAAKPPTADPLLIRTLKSEEIVALLDFEGINATLAQATQALNNYPLVVSSASLKKSAALDTPLDAIVGALDLLQSCDPTSFSDLIKIHSVLAWGLGSEPLWRASGATTPLPDGRRMSGVQALSAPGFLESLLDWYATTELHPLVASCVFRFEYGNVNPFSAASMLTGRLWYSLMLRTWEPILEFVPLEAVLVKRKQKLANMILESRRRINDSLYVVFVLEALRDAMTLVIKRESESAQTTSRHDLVVEYFHQHPTSTINEAAHALGIAARTCARHVAMLQNEGRLVRVGGRKNGHWQTPNQP